MIEDSWQYLEGMTTKHLLYTSSRGIALCGRGPMWHSTEKWKNDEETLSKLRKCKTCVKIDGKSNEASS